MPSRRPARCRPSNPAGTNRVRLNTLRSPPAASPGEGLLQHVFVFRRPLIVVGRDRDQERRFRFRRLQMRAVGIRRYEPASVERRDRADAIGNSGGGAKRDRAAHAIALRADLRDSC